MVMKQFEEIVRTMIWAPVYLHSSAPKYITYVAYLHTYNNNIYFMYSNYCTLRPSTISCHVTSPYDGYPRMKHSKFIQYFA